jgi:hypothetical protein
MRQEGAAGRGSRLSAREPRSETDGSYRQHKPPDIARRIPEKASHMFPSGVRFARIETALLRRN